MGLRYSGQGRKSILIHAHVPTHVQYFRRTETQRRLRLIMTVRTFRTDCQCCLLPEY